MTDDFTTPDAAETADSKIAVIIPLAVGEQLWRQAAADISALADRLTAANRRAVFSIELIFAAAESAPADLPFASRWLVCERRGRAAQMNFAAGQTDADFLWFVHADTRIGKDAADALGKIAGENDGREKGGGGSNAENGGGNCDNTIYYFGLRFYDGGFLMRLTEIGVWLRCVLFRNPFGDQALMLRRGAFFALGGFDENAAFGEDHLLVIAARKRGFRIIRLPAAAATSARKYQRRGWLRTTLRHQYLWIKQFRADK